MCGIAGIIFSNKLNINQYEDVVRRTLDKIGHRGPDYRGIVSYQASIWNICLGMNRLAIIDLTDTGNQPMRLDNLTIVYNGEVYNYLELKEDLIKRGHKFKGNSDTEVVLHSFKEWGVDCVQKFIGMFAIAIFDRVNDNCYLFRDRLGEKPLYYYYDENIFIFSSELKGLLVHDFIKRTFEKQSIFNYLIFNSAGSPYTLFKEIKQISPGEFLTVSCQSKGLKMQLLKYWQLPDLKPDYSLAEKKVLSDLESLIYDAVKLRLRSDVPLGIFLSGGIDSSLIACVAASISPNIKTFTIGYKDKKYDESNYAEFVAKHIKVKHTTIFLDEDSAELDFSKISYISDDCTANPTFIPYNSLVKKTREYVKVALSGDGGDEFFCGYKKSYGIITKLFKYRNIFKAISAIFILNGKIRVLNKILSEVSSLNTLIGQFVVRDKISEVRKLIKNDEECIEIYRRINAEEKLFGNMKLSFWGVNFYEGGGNYLPDTVLKTTDRASMFHSLEVRPIFTDHRIVEYMARVPERIVLKNGIDKFLLRKILSRYLPKGFVFKRVKRGFSVPLYSDYRAKWQKAISEAQDIFSAMEPDIFDLVRLKNILTGTKNRRNRELQSRLVFLAGFIKLWRVS